MLNSSKNIDRLFAWTLNLEGEFTYLSPKVTEILGYEPSELLFKTFFEIIPGETSEGFAEKFNFHKKNVSTFWSMKMNLLKKSGDRVLMEINVIPWYDEKKQFCGFEGIAYEV